MIFSTCVCVLRISLYILQGIVLCACTRAYPWFFYKGGGGREQERKNEARRMDIHIDIVFLFFSSRIDYRMIGLQFAQLKWVIVWIRVVHKRINADLKKPLRRKKNIILSARYLNRDKFRFFMRNCFQDNKDKFLNMTFLTQSCWISIRKIMTKLQLIFNDN